MTKEKLDQDAIYLQITAGQGPKECCWVVAQVIKKIIEDADNHSVRAKIVESIAYEKALRKQTLIEPDAYLSCLIRLQGDQALACAMCWKGVIKWQGQSPYRPRHKRINWFVSVGLVNRQNLGQMCQKQLEKEVQWSAMRARGAGGQHVNKTSSAVRLVHIATGITVREESERSQYRNRQLAMQRLIALLSDQQNANNAKQAQTQWQQHYQVQRGDAARVFSGADFVELTK